MSTLTTRSELIRWERELIALFDAQRVDVGYNVADGHGDTAIAARDMVNTRWAAATPQHRIENGRRAALARWSKPRA